MSAINLLKAQCELEANGVVCRCKLERDLAELQVAALRDGGKSAVEILLLHTLSTPTRDREYEDIIFAQHGVRIATDRVKAQMKRLVVC